MKKIDISKLTENGLYHVYYKLVDNKVNEILSKKDGELTSQDIIDYQHTQFEVIHIEDIANPIKDIKVEELPKDMPLGDYLALLDKHEADLDRYDWFEGLLACFPTDVLTHLERLWINKEIPGLSDKQVYYLIKKKESQLAEEVAFLKEFLNN